MQNQIRPTDSRSRETDALAPAEPSDDKPRVPPQDVRRAMWRSPSLATTQRTTSAGTAASCSQMPSSASSSATPTLARSAASPARSLRSIEQDGPGFGSSWFWLIGLNRCLFSGGGFDERLGGPTSAIPTASKGSHTSLPTERNLLLAAQFLHKELSIRIAHRAQYLDSLPFGLSTKPAILKVTGCLRRSWGRSCSMAREAATAAAAIAGLGI
ncbi:hypothetical protein ABZP36_027736 [Zizania latifolia]